MIIRGIDFARHNVIVGTDAEHPVPNSAQGQQPRGEMVARVLQAAGGEATLDLGGQRVVVQTHVPLNTGDKLTVRVFQGEGGAIRLSILASEPDVGTPPAKLVETDVDALLRELGLPTDDRTRHAARALLARDGTLDKAELQKLVADLKTFPKVTAEVANAAALLQKAGAPINQATVGVMIARAEPNGPMQVGTRLMAIAPGLEALQRQLPPRSPQAALVAEALTLLKGLPLEEGAGATRVDQALRHWLGKLQPDVPKTTSSAQGGAGAQPSQGGPAETDAQGGAIAGQGGPVASQGRLTPNGQGGPTADTAPAVAGGQPSLAGLPAAKAGILSAALLQALAEALPEEAQPEEAARPGGVITPRDAVAVRADGLRQPAERTDPAKQGLERAERVSPSQNFLARLGISTKVLEPAGSDLASMLERLSKALGPEHQKLGNALTEAVAELRYAQLANTPTPSSGPAQGMEFLVPLLLPHLSSEHPEGRLQVFHKPNKPGEPIDPNNVRLVFVLETEHLQTVQADMSIKDGVVELTLGVPDAQNRKFLESHLGELRSAIADHGWETGRFGARLARGLPPRVRQEEGLSEIVRFDRRV